MHTQQILITFPKEPEMITSKIPSRPFTHREEMLKALKTEKSRNSREVWMIAAAEQHDRSEAALDRLEEWLDAVAQSIEEGEFDSEEFLDDLQRTKVGELRDARQGLNLATLFTSKAE